MCPGDINKSPGCEISREGLSRSAMASGKSSGDRGELPRGTAASGKSPRDRIGLSGSGMASGMISGGKGVVSRCPGAAGSTVVPYGGSVISSKALREVLAEGDVR